MILRLTICFLLTNLSFAQRNFLNVNLEGLKSNNSLKEAYLIKDLNTDNLFVILEEEKTTHAFKYDANKTLGSQMTSEGLKRKFKEIVGHIVNENQLLLLQKNKKGNKLAYIKYNFETKQTEEVEYDLEDSSDRFVESFITADKCVLFTINTSNEAFKKWEFNIDGSFQVEEINTESLFASAGISYEPLDFFLVDSQGFSRVVDLTKVNNKIPNNLEIVTDNNKMYERKKSFLWTIDHYLDYTLVFYFDAPDYNPVLKLVNKPKLRKNSFNAKSNSFIFDDKIAQVVSSNKELLIDIKELNNPSNLIKSIRVDKDADIDFKNSPILQEGSSYSFGGTRKMEKTSKLLRKMSSDDNGISVYKNNDRYHITIGGTRVQTSGGGAPMIATGFSGMPVGHLGGINQGYNPTFYAYGMYSNTGSTRIECLFDLDFNHIQGEIDDNVFDRIDDYKDVEDDLRTESITYLNSEVIFGYWKPKEFKYYFKIFE